MDPIIPVRRQEPFDDPAYVFELKLDGFRAVADTRADQTFPREREALNLAIRGD